MATRKKGVSKLLGEVLDNVKDFADEIVDRLSDAERDIRRGLTRLLEERDSSAPDRDRPHLPEDPDSVTGDTPVSARVESTATKP
ncbi:hypothetical protein ACIRL2_42460 [Embleya sp. NPDC127516]|uniref:hypothetical protein n=1 Tax=Embleya sp. NPDC127516 TaxID=3363990 RepID=UPI0037FE2C27